MKEGQAEYDEDTDIKFIVQSDKDLAFLDSSFGCMRDHLQQWATEKNKSRESCRIAYHALEPDVGGTWSFQATLIQEVCCRMTPLDATDAVTQMSAGTLMTPRKWCSDNTALVWMVKSTVNGFQPVRPVIAFTSEIDIPPKKAFVLKSSA